VRALCERYPDKMQRVPTALRIRRQLLNQQETKEFSWPVHTNIVSGDCI